MAKHLFKYQGRFQWWLYNVTHGQLLLRSTSTSSPARGTQVDVLFKDVNSVSLPTVFEDLEVLESEGDFIPPIVGSVGGRKVYVIRASDVEGFIVAGAAFHVEGQGHHNDPSPLIPPFPPLKSTQ